MPAQRAQAAVTLIGVDVGSTHIKVALVAPGSGVLYVARRATETHAVRGGGAYHRSAELLAAVNSAIAECVAEADGKVGPPAAIGIASMAEAGVPVDRRNLPVGDILAWHDPRPERQAAWLERQIGAAPLFARTGLRPEPKYTLPKLLWLREQKAADFTRLRHWAGVAELVALDLTGELATNASLACRTLAFDVTKRAWDPELLALASLGPDEMPVVLPLGRPVGGLTAGFGCPAGPAERDARGHRRPRPSRRGPRSRRDGAGRRPGFDGQRRGRPARLPRRRRSPTRFAGAASRPAATPSTGSPTWPAGCSRPER